MSRFYLLSALVFGLGLLVNQLILPVTPTTYAGACSNGGDPYGGGCHFQCKIRMTGRVTNRANGNPVSNFTVSTGAFSSCTDENGTHPAELFETSGGSDGNGNFSTDIYNNSSYYVRPASIPAGLQGPQPGSYEAQSQGGGPGEGSGCAANGGCNFTLAPIYVYSQSAYPTPVPPTIQAATPIPIPTPTPAAAGECNDGPYSCGYPSSSWQPNACSCGGQFYRVVNCSTQAIIRYTNCQCFSCATPTPGSTPGPVYTYGQSYYYGQNYYYSYGQSYYYAQSAYPYIQTEGGNVHSQ